MLCENCIACQKPAEIAPMLLSYTVIKVFVILFLKNNIFLESEELMLCIESPGTELLMILRAMYSFLLLFRIIISN